MTLKNRLFLPLFLSLTAVEALLALAWMLSTPSDAQTARLFGLSSSRLALAGFLSLAAAGGLFLALRAWRQPASSLAWLESHLLAPHLVWRTALFSGLVFLAAGSFLAVPSEYLGKLWAIEERLRPVTLWLLLFGLQSLAALTGWQIHRQSGKKIGETLRPAALFLALFLAVWGFISLTKLGLTGGSSFWSKVGVPLLWPQIFLALGLGLLLAALLSRFRTRLSLTWVDLGLAVLLWLTAVLLWNSQPYTPGVFNTPARPPTYEIYPTNDSFIFDLTAQKMLNGWLMSGDAHDKPLFIAHLVLLHFLAGKSYKLFYLYQIFSFAFIPILGYLLGKNLHSRPLGLFFAVLLILKEQNAIALTNYINVSTSKLILSEELTSLGVLLFSLALVSWLKDPHPRNPKLWLAGGLLGLTSLVRLNAISILPVALLLIGLALRFKLKPWVWTAVLFSLFLALSAAPWLARNVTSSGNPFNFILNKTDGVLVAQRYKPMVETPNPTPNTSQPAGKSFSRYLTLAHGMVTNYLHNLVGVTLMLPPSLKLYSLTDLTRLPYWRIEWDGSLLPGAFGLILAILALTAWGLAVAWQRWRAAGLVPLAVLLGYNLTTAISLTSGGRYLVPFDWVVLFYFACGLFEAALWFLALFGWPTHPPVTDLPAPQTSAPLPGWQRSLVIVSLGLLLVGSLPVLLERLPPRLYPRAVTSTDFFNANGKLPELTTSNLAKKLSNLTRDPQAQVLFGRVLYPRYYGENKGDGLTLEIDPLIGLASQDRLTFMLLAEKGRLDESPILLPYSGKISSGIAGTEAWVIGCQRENYVEAAVVIFRVGETVKLYQPETLPTSCQ